MERFALDPETGDRLLSGALHPEDAPGRYSAVAALLQAAAVPTGGALDGEAATVDAIVGAIRSTPEFQARQRTSLMNRAKVAVAGLVGALTLTSGLAAANALPGPVQRAASDALGEVGVHVPNPDHHDKADHPGVGTVTPVDDTAGNTNPDGTHPDNKGAQISDLAHNTDPGPGHGAAVSGAASDGKSHAGQPHGKPDTPGGPPSSTPAANKDNGGGNPSEGSTGADEHSNGAGSSGQSNAGGRKP